MNRLSLELQRLYGTDAPDGRTEALDTPRLVDGAGRVRALVLGVSAPADWAVLSPVWQAVQADLGLPAPAIAVGGEAGYQLWFSLAQAVSAAQGHGFLAGLQQRYLGELPARRVALWPSVSVDSASAQTIPGVPRALPGGERWSAFVAQDLAPVFADEPWLDLPPNADGQAQLLASLGSIRPGDFDMALQALRAGAPLDDETSREPDAGGPPTAREAAAGIEDEPRRFLLQVMNDPATPLALRIEAAKALLPAR